MVTTSYWSGKDSIAFGMISNVVVHDNDLYFVLGVQAATLGYFPTSPRASGLYKSTGPT